MEEKIFAGLKVVDCGSFIAAPAAATILSDFGADVIKIEPPKGGDPYRHLPLLPGNPKSVHNYAWLLDARNKRSLALDLSNLEGQAVLHRLVSDVDVFITNYPPGIRGRLGVDYERLAQLNERLIYASFTGYGERGREANKPGFDVTAWWARSGLMDFVRTHAEGEPVRPTPGMGDHPSAVALLAGILTALYRRERSGKGALVGSSLVANGIWANGYLAQAALCGAEFIPRPKRVEALNALTTYYKCRDQRWLILTVLNEERQWPLLARSLGREDLITDPRFAAKSDRHAHSKELVTLLDGIFATKNRSEWQAAFLTSGIVFEVVASPDEIPNDSQLLENRVLVRFERDEMLTVDSPFFVAGVDKVEPRKPPSLGQHTDEILQEFGFESAKIEELRAAGTVK